MDHHGPDNVILIYDHIRECYPELKVKFQDVVETRKTIIEGIFMAGAKRNGRKNPNGISGTEIERINKDRVTIEEILKVYNLKELPVDKNCLFNAVREAVNEEITEINKFYKKENRKNIKKVKDFKAKRRQQKRIWRRQIGKIDEEEELSNELTVYDYNSKDLGREGEETEVKCRGHPCKEDRIIEEEEERKEEDEECVTHSNPAVNSEKALRNPILNQSLKITEIFKNPKNKTKT